MSQSLLSASTTQATPAGQGAGRRRRILVAGLLLALGATWWASQQGDEVDDSDLAVAAPNPRSAAQKAAAASTAPPARWPLPPGPRVLAWAAPSAGGWAPLSVAPAPVAAARRSVVAAVDAAAPPPPRPVAPAFAYQLIGLLHDGGATRALLSGPLRTLGVQAGDQIDGQWRVDGVDGNGLRLTWLPGPQALIVPFRASAS